MQGRQRKRSSRPLVAAIVWSGFVSATAAQVPIPAPPLRPNQYGDFIDSPLEDDGLTLSQDGLGVRALYRVRAESGATDAIARIDPPAGVNIQVGDEIRVQPAQAGTLTIDDGNFIALSGNADFAMDSPLDLLVLMWDGNRWLEITRNERDLGVADQTVVYRHHASGEYWALVPMAAEPGVTEPTPRYARFVFRNPEGLGVTLGAIGECLPGDFLAHSAGSGVTKTGDWANSTVSGTPTANTTRSATPGDTVAFTVTGHAIALNVPTISNGGVFLVTVDGGSALANRLPQVAASDYATVSAAVDNGSGLLRVTTATPHKLSGGARVYAEGLGGITLPGPGPWTVSVLSSTIIDLEGTSGWSGTYSSGGAVGYFRAGDVGARYGSCGPINSTTGELWRLVGEGLADEEHEVEVEVLGTCFSGATGRTYVNGVAAASASTEFTAGTSTGVLPFDTFLIHDYRSSSTISNVVYAPEFKADDFGPGSFQFCTGTHGNETQISVSYNLDGAPLSLANDAYAIGYELEVPTVGEITYDGTPVANFAQTFRLKVGGTYQARAIGTVSWLVDGQLQEDYRGMLPLAVRNPNAATPAVLPGDFDRFVIGGATYTDEDFTLDEELGNFSASAVEAYSTSHSLRVRLQRLDGSIAPRVFFLPRGDGLYKFYMNDRPNAGGSRAVDDETVDQFDFGYHVSRRPN